MQKKIHIIEDDENTSELMRYILASAGYEVLVFERGEDFLKSTKIQIPSLLLLDNKLSGLNGFELIKQIRSNERLKDLPVIIVSARSSEIDKAQGLDLGADDYIVKPFGNLELIARINAVLRRGPTILEKPRQYFKDLIVDAQGHDVYKGDVKIDLTLKEYELLMCFLENRGRVLTREQLLQRLWGNDLGKKSRTVDMHIKTLRQKIGDSFNHSVYISTIRGLGYKLESGSA